MRRMDCYGEVTEEATFWRHTRPDPLETKKVGDCTYMRFTDPPSGCVIHRVAADATGMIEETWALGSWDDVESLEYMPLDQTKEMVA